RGSGAVHSAAGKTRAGRKMRTPTAVVGTETTDVSEPEGGAAGREAQLTSVRASQSPNPERLPRDQDTSPRLALLPEPRRTHRTMRQKNGPGVPQSGGGPAGALVRAHHVRDAPSHFRRRRGDPRPLFSGSRPRLRSPGGLHGYRCLHRTSCPSLLRLRHTPHEPDPRSLALPAPPSAHHA